MLGVLVEVLLGVFLLRLNRLLAGLRVVVAVRARLVVAVLVLLDDEVPAPPLIELGGSMNQGGRCGANGLLAPPPAAAWPLDEDGI